MGPADDDQKDGAHHGVESKEKYDFVEAAASPIRANHVHDIGGADDERAPQGHRQVQVIVSKMPFDLFDVLPVPKYVGRKKEREKNTRDCISFGHSAERYECALIFAPNGPNSRVFLADILAP